MAGKLKYSDFAKKIDLDAVYTELGWEPEDRSEKEDKGYCLDLWGLHKHGDTTGKFAFNREKMVYNCWVCGGGTLLSLVMEAKQMDYQQATNWLFGFTKITDESPEEFANEIAELLEPQETAEKPLPYFNSRVLTAWEKNDHPWFAERGIIPEVKKTFQLGYDPMHRRYGGERGTYEGPAIILPHFWEDRLVGWQERWLNDDRPKWIGKYTNTTDFPRERTLFGYDFCKKIPAKVVLVESVPTALFLLSNGFPAMATFGAEMTPQQMMYLRRFTKGVILARDNDKAGVKWEFTNTNYLERFIPVFHVDPVDRGEGADLGDLSPEELSEHMKGMKHGIPEVYTD